MRGALAGAAMFLAGCHVSTELATLEAKAAPGATPLRALYEQQPNVVTPMQGFFSTGMALADLDGDGWLDMVVSNGNDYSPQPVTVYYNTTQPCKPFSSIQHPGWYSQDNAYRAGLAVGDVNGDGFPDVAVASPMSLYRTYEGGVAIYMNQGGQLEDTPSWRTADSFAATAVAFADVNADGKLDLVVTSLAEGSLPSSGSYPGGRQRIYLQGHDGLERSPSWKSAECGAEGQAECLVAADILAADIDQDGWMDIGVAAQRAAIFYGQPGAGVLPGQNPGWVSHERFIASYSLDAGWIDMDAGGPLALAVASNCLAASNCNTNIHIYRPAAGAAPVWSSKKLDNASKLLLADLNADGALDLVGTQMGVGFVGAPVIMYEGPLLEARHADFVSSPNPMGQGIAVGDVRNLAVETVEHVFTSSEPRAVLTLPERRIRAITAVERIGVDGQRSTPRYAWASGANWLSLGAPLQPGEELLVRYEISPVQDVAIAVASPNSGNYVFYSRYQHATCIIK